MTRPLSPGGTGLRAQLVERMASPELTDGLKDMHNQMLIKQLTAAEKRVKDLEGENMRLKEQVCLSCRAQLAGIADTPHSSCSEQGRTPSGGQHAQAGGVLQVQGTASLLSDSL